MPSHAAPLPAAEWLALSAAHEARVRPWVASRLERTGRGEKHPVYDFHYGYRPGRLARWEPGYGRTLAGPEASAFLKLSGYAQVDGGVAADLAELTPKRLDFIGWLHRFLTTVRDRPPFFGCFGLHEWAMVYRTDDIRHSLPLRMPPDELARFVDSQAIRCSHHDAFRFFTPAARPLNRLQPETRESVMQHEQCGCVHANMDLYKWAYKLHPFCPSELLADTFELSAAARELDMRASAYDCSSLGFAPIRIETTEGKSEYEAAQRAISVRAAPLRQRLIDLCAELLAAAPAGHAAGRPSVD